MIESILQRAVRIVKRIYVPARDDVTVVIVGGWYLDAAFAERKCRAHFGGVHNAAL